MKVGILAGGRGSRLAEETQVRPKPLVEIGGRPILWHIMRHYSVFGYREFVIALGYKGDMVKRYFIESSGLHGSMRVNTRTGRVTRDSSLDAVDWDVHLIDTGEQTATGGRIRRLIPHMGGETFMLTWGDGVADVDLRALLDFHRSHGRLATLTAVRPPARYGQLTMEGDRIIEFTEKPQIGEGWINGAFFVLEPAVADYIDGDDVMFEQEPLTQLASDGQLMAFRHESFWQCMDTLRERQILETLWESGEAPWKTWSTDLDQSSVHLQP